MEVVNGFDTKNVLGCFGTKKDLVGGVDYNQESLVNENRVICQCSYGMSQNFSTEPKEI